MGKKEVKTNAMRILDRKKISYEYQTYECDEFTDGIETADKLNLPHEQVYKTIVTTGKSGEHYVFVLPIEAEIDFKKAAKAVGEKSIEMLRMKKSELQAQFDELSSSITNHTVFGQGRIIKAFPEMKHRDYFELIQELKKKLK